MSPPTPVLTAALDRTGAQLRPMAADDGDLVRQLLEGLSFDDRYQRFLSPMPVIPDRLVEGIVAVDRWCHPGRVAVVDGRAVGEATAHRVGPSSDRAELGVTVAADHRRSGLASSLIRALAGDAAAVGITAFDVDVSPSNLASRALMRRLGASMRFDSGTLVGELSVEALLDAPAVPVRERPRAAA